MPTLCLALCKCFLRRSDDCHIQPTAKGSTAWTVSNTAQHRPRPPSSPADHRFSHLCLWQVGRAAHCLTFSTAAPIRPVPKSCRSSCVASLCPFSLTLPRHACSGPLPLRDCPPSASSKGPLRPPKPLLLRCHSRNHPLFKVVIGHSTCHRLWDLKVRKH